MQTTAVAVYNIEIVSIANGIRHSKCHPASIYRYRRSNDLLSQPFRRQLHQSGSIRIDQEQGRSTVRVLPCDKIVAGYKHQFSTNGRHGDTPHIIINDSCLIRDLSGTPGHHIHGKQLTATIGIHARRIRRTDPCKGRAIAGHHHLIGAIQAGQAGSSTPLIGMEHMTIHNRTCKGDIGTEGNMASVARQAQVRDRPVKPAPWPGIITVGELPDDARGHIDHEHFQASVAVMPRHQIEIRDTCHLAAVCRDGDVGESTSIDRGLARRRGQLRNLTESSIYKENLASQVRVLACNDIAIGNDGRSATYGSHIDAIDGTQ